MSAKSYPSLEELEREVRSRTRAEQVEALGLAEKLLNFYLAGFRELSPITPQPQNELEWARRLLANRSFNSLRCACELLQLGYYTQALTLCRCVAEDWLTSVDCETHPDTLQVLLHGQGRMPKFEAMAKRNGPDVLKAWRGVASPDEGLYGVLSTITHPRARGLRMLLDHERGLLRLGGSYDAFLFAFSSYYLIRVGRLYSAILLELVAAAGTAAWVEQLGILLDEAMRWEDKMISLAKAELHKASGRAS